MNSFFNHMIYNKYTAKLTNKYYETKLKGLKSFIFIATIGRSGTLTLVDIFNQLDECIALHEPYPAMHDNILNAAANGDHQLVKNFYNIRKSVNIRRNAVGSEHYMEANHLFIKTFVQYAAEDFDSRLKIIHLVRNPKKVANSIYALQDQPGTIEGNRWWLDYHAPTNLISIPEILDTHQEFKHPYYKALWYWFETEARISAWKKKLPQVPFIFFMTENFNNEEKLSALFKQLEISIPSSFIKNVVNLRSHARSHQKKLSPLPEKTTNEMLDHFIALLNKKNISIPSSINAYR